MILPELDLKILIGPVFMPFQLGHYLHHPNIKFFYVDANHPYQWAKTKDIEEKWQGGIKLDTERSLKFCWRDILDQLPANWEPDVVIWTSFHVFTLPTDLDQCPYPLILSVSDWHGEYRAIKEYSRAFDYILADQLLVNRLQQLGLDNVGYWPCYSFSPELFYCPTASERPWDVSFIGSFQTSVHHDRNAYLFRLANLADQYRIKIQTHVYDQDYLAVWQQTKIAFNYSVRKEMNLRAYEATACGALLFQEEENLEIDNFLTPGQDYVAYKQSNLEELVHYYLSHSEERIRIACNGAERIQQYCYDRQFGDLVARLPILLESIQARAKARTWHHVPHVTQTLLRAKLNLSFHVAEVNQQNIKHLYQLCHQQAHNYTVYWNAWAVTKIHLYRHLSNDISLTSEFDPGMAQLCQQIETSIDTNGPHFEAHPIVVNNLMWIAYQSRNSASFERYSKLQEQLLSKSNWELSSFADFVIPLTYSRFNSLWQEAIFQDHEEPLAAHLNLLRWSMNYLNGLQEIWQKNPPGAYRYLCQAIEAAPTLPESYFAMAFLCIQTQYWQESIPFLWNGLRYGLFFINSWIILIDALIRIEAYQTAAKAVSHFKCLFNGECYQNYSPRIQRYEYLIQLALNQQEEGFLKADLDNSI